MSEGQPTGARSGAVKRKAGSGEPVEPDSNPYFSVMQLGAVKGNIICGLSSPSDADILRASAESVEMVTGVKLAVVSGCIPALSTREKLRDSNRSNFGRAEVIAWIQKRWPEEAPDNEAALKKWAVLLSGKLGIPLVLATSLVMMSESEECQSPFSNTLGMFGRPEQTFEYMGEPCMLEIVELGAWARVDEDGEPFDTPLQRMAASGEPQLALDIFNALDETQKLVKTLRNDKDVSGPGKWSMDSNKWVVLAGSSSRTSDDVMVDSHNDVYSLLGDCTSDDARAVFNLAIRADEPPIPVALPVPAGSGNEALRLTTDPDELVPLIVKAYMSIRSAIAWVASNQYGADLTPDDGGTILSEEEAANDARYAVEWLNENSNGYGAGFLKSAVQKTVRFYCKVVKIERTDPQTGSDTTQIDSAIYAMACLAMCMTKRGDAFIPDLQTFVKGHISGFKRAVVVMVEDGVPLETAVQNAGFSKDMDTGKAMSSLLYVAFASARVYGYSPTRGTIDAALRLVGLAAKSPAVLDWRDPQSLGSPAPGVGPERKHSAPVNPSNGADSWKNATDTLKQLRSFEGDLNMLDRVYEQSKTGSLKFVSWTADPHPIMPELHSLDTHVHYGIGFACYTMEADSQEQDAMYPFRPRHHQIFGDCTGFNPRTRETKLKKSDTSVKQVRFAQRCIELTLHDDRSIDPSKLPGASAAVNPVVHVDYGTMAGAVGPVSVTVKTTSEEDEQDDIGVTKGSTWKLRVILPNANSQEQVIREPPGRGKIEDAPIPPSDSAVKKAILAVHELGKKPAGLRASSPMLPGVDKVRYINGGWHICFRESDKQPQKWLYLDGNRPNAIKIEQMTIPNPPGWPSTVNTQGQTPTPMDAHVKAMLANDNAMLSALKTYDTTHSCVARDAEPIVKAMMRVMSRGRRARLASRLRQAYKSVSMPTPSRDGGKGTDQVLAVNGDWRVYRALLLISQLVPGALRPQKLPTFKVTNALLLREVEKWVQSQLTTSLSSKAQNANQNLWQATYNVLEEAFSNGGRMSTAEYPHQRALVSLMRHRDETSIFRPPAHFLRSDTGSGKTLMCIWYAARYAFATGACDRVIWLTRAHVIQSAIEQMTLPDKMGLSGFAVVTAWNKATRLTNVNAALKGSTPKPVILLASHEDLSTPSTSDKLVEDLKSAAATSLIVVDEVHKFYSSTKRTSNILEVCDASPKQVLATACPPLVGKSTPMAAEWLARSVSFYYSPNSEVVACSQLVAAYIEKPYDIEIQYFGSALTPAQSAEVLKTSKQLADSGGGSFQVLAKQARGFINPTIVHQAMLAAFRDRFYVHNGKRPFADGGCLVIADNQTEAEELANEINEHLSRTADDKWPLHPTTKKPVKFKAAARKQTPEFDNDSSYGIIVIDKGKAEGWDCPRFGFCVSTVLASSPATRLQLRGRLLRMALQKHTREHESPIRFQTYYPENTVLHMLLMQHSNMDFAIKSLDTLAKKHVESIVRG
jgi:superfamily II DNA or RNA helicase